MVMDWPIFPDDRLSRAGINRRMRFDHRLEDVVARLSNAGSIFDKDHRLVACNQLFRDYLQVPRTLAQPGTGLADLLNYHARHGTFLAQDEQTGRAIAAWQKTHLDHLARSKPYDQIQRLADGRILLATYAPIPEGGWIAIHRDYTQRAVRETTVRARASI